LKNRWEGSHYHLRNRYKGNLPKVWKIPGEKSRHRKKGGHLYKDKKIFGCREIAGARLCGKGEKPHIFGKNKEESEWQSNEVGNLLQRGVGKVMRRPQKRKSKRELARCITA